MEYEKIPIHLKMTLTIKEAAEYSNIGINKIIDKNHVLDDDIYEVDIYSKEKGDE